MSARLPYFRCYAPDVIDQMAGLPLQARGLYLTLICRQWIDGYLPASAEALARAARVPLAQFNPAWRHIAHLFPEVEGGVRAIVDLAEQREVALSKGAAAQAAAAARWDKWRAHKALVDANALHPLSERSAISISSKSRTLSESETTSPREKAARGKNSRSAPTASALDSWPARVAEILASVGMVQPGRVGVAFKDLVAKEGEELVLKAAQAFVKRALAAPVDKGYLRDTGKFLREGGWWVDYVRPGGARLAMGDFDPDPTSLLSLPATDSEPELGFL